MFFCSTIATAAGRCVSARDYRLFTIMTKVLQTAAHLMFWSAIAITVVGLALQYNDEVVRDY
jgi:type IV secretory pathway VirB3-like protein